MSIKSKKISVTSQNKEFPRGKADGRLVTGRRQKTSIVYLFKVENFESLLRVSFCLFSLSCNKSINKSAEDQRLFPLKKIYLFLFIANFSGTVFKPSSCPQDKNYLMIQGKQPWN